MCNTDSNMSLNDLSSDVIYIDPSETSFVDCTKCWELPKIALKKDVIIENPKYCWLYPKSQRKKLKKVEPNFDNLESLYTKCDFELEACAHQQILFIEDLLKCHEQLLNTEVQYQKELIEKLWTESYRYLLLTRSSCCIKYYPEIVSKPTEQRALCDFFKFLTKLHQSNCRLNKSVCTIRNAIQELDRRYELLDKSVDSPFIKGDGAKISPLDDIYELMYHVYRYFFFSLCQLKCWAQLIDPVDTSAINQYCHLLNILNNFKAVINYGRENCTCYRTNARVCIKSNKAC